MTILKRILKRVLSLLIVRPASFVLKRSPYKVLLITVDRFGHLASNTHLFFIRYQLSACKDKYILIYPSEKNEDIANKELLTMFVKHAQQYKYLYTISCSLLYVCLDFLTPDFKDMGISIRMPMDTKEKEFSLGIDTITFDKEKKEYGESLIANMPISKEKKIVTVFARDSSYLKHRFPDIDWSYHSYRDCDIATYIKAIEYLISKNYTVIRVGSEFSSPLNIKHKDYFEYALSSFKSDFLDLYLIYKSEFVVGSTSGATDIALIFNIPFVGVNYAPFMESPLGKNDIYIQKKLASLEGKIIPFKEVIDNCKYYSYDGNTMKNKYGITYVDNTSEEILAAVKEMHKRVLGNYNLNKDQDLVLKRYYNEFCSRNSWSSRAAPISIDWLQNNQKLYLDD